MLNSKGLIRFDFFTRRAEFEMFRKIVESAPNAIILVDRDGKITLVNAQTEKLFGYAREILIGQPVEMLLPERFRATHPAHRSAFFASPSTRAMGVGRDLYGLRKGGSEFPIEIGLNPIEAEEGLLVLASIIDLTRRKRAEERFRRLFESAPNAIILANREGKITLVNGQTEKLFGYSRETLLGQTVEMLVPERFRAKHPGQRTNFFSSPSARAMGVGPDLYGLHRDGHEFPLEIGLNPIEGDEGLLVLASIIDVTERKRSAEALRRLMRETQETVNVLSSATAEITASTTQIASASAEAAAAVSQTTATIEEVKQTAQVSTEKARHVSETAQKTARISQSGKKSVEESIEAMRRIQEQMESIAESIVRLSEQGQAIAEIIATVNDLAEQSNLLAVNAAIEAARAGDQGRGFAVVAQEVKSLAEQSKQATAQVRTILGDIQKATSAAVMATEQGSKAVKAGVRQSTEAGESIRVLADSIEEAAQSATQIAASSRQQLVGMDQVALAMENIKQAATQNVATTKQTEASAQNLHNLGQKLKQLVEQYKL